MTIADLTPKERLAVRNLKVLMTLWPQSLRVRIDADEVTVSKEATEIARYPYPARVTP